MTVWQTTDPTARLTDEAAIQQPRETTFADAQEGMNFVVFEPGWLPSDCSIEKTTVRPEQPPGRPDGIEAGDFGQTPHSEGNPAALRAVIEGDDRRLRIKEFLYDWAPPSASVAPLWRTDDPTPVDCGDAVGWLGIDYKDNRGACVQRDRTQIEVSVLDGEFTDDELERLLAGLEPANEPEAWAVRRAPYHTLNYWVRYRCEPVAVPHGLWSFSPVRPYHESQPLSPVTLAVGETAVRPLVTDDENYLLDSAVAFPDAEATECVFRHRANGSDHCWVTAAAVDSPLAPADPPEPSEQPAETREAWNLRGTTVHYAALDEEHGAWEAIWTEDGVRYGMYAGASKHLDDDGFRALVDELVAP